MKKKDKQKVREIVNDKIQAFVGSIVLGGLVVLLSYLAIIYRPSETNFWTGLGVTVAILFLVVLGTLAILLMVYAVFEE